MQKLSRKYSNKEYAPGLALYGIDGADGISGQSGCSLFVCKYDITSFAGTSEFGTNIKQGMSMTQNDDVPIGRPYINGDVFLFPDGNLYKLTNVQEISVAAGNLTEEAFHKYTELVGHVNVSAATDNFSEATGRLVLDTDAYKGFIINMSDVNMDSVARDINAPLTIISGQETGNGRIYFMGLKSIYAGSSDAQLDIYFDTRNNAYVIDSDKDILIDADVRVSSSGDSNEYDDYSHVLTTENSVTAWGGVCSKVSWTMTKPQRYVYELDDPTPEEPGRKTLTTDEIYWSERNPIRSSVEWYFPLDDSVYTKYVIISVIRKVQYKDNHDSKDIRYEFKSNGTRYSQRTFSSGTGRCFTTEKIFVPLIFSGDYPELIVTAPAEFFVVVESDGANVDMMKIDGDKEDIKKVEIQGEDSAEMVITTTGGLYDPTRVYVLRYERRLTLRNDGDTDAEALKSAIVHIAGVARKSTLANQKLMEYYVQLSDDNYPKSHGTLDVSIISDYGLEDVNGGNDYRWEVSLIGNTEFFIEEK